MSNISPLARLLYRHFASGGWDAVARAVEQMIAEAKRPPTLPPATQTIPACSRAMSRLERGGGRLSTCRDGHPVSRSK